MPATTPDDDSPGFEAIDLFGPSEIDAASPAGDDPAIGDDHQTPAAGAKIVQGIVCSRGHFNRPDGKFCARCGISMVHQTHNIVSGERPPLGVLVLDDGSVFALRDDLVIGREPEASADVLNGSAQPLLLDDTALTLSRVHARVILDGWEVRVEDAGSANGTYVMGPSADAWTRLEPEQPTTIEPGSRLSVGGRTLTFESHQRD